MEAKFESIFYRSIRQYAEFQVKYAYLLLTTENSSVQHSKSNNNRSVEV